MFALILITSLIVAFTNGLPQVKLDNGFFTGIQMQSYVEKDFNAFLGIPYAKPPIGKLRFKNPVEYGPYIGDYAANNDSIICIQTGFPKGERIIGHEDCLYLNVYTPKIFNDKKLAVLVFIHGGANTGGAGTHLYYGPDYLLEHDIILVTPNYRLGPLGFLTTEDKSLPGNYGLKDIRLALKWIQKYITQFGGDPNQVTIYGESSGAVSVHLQTLAEDRTGLFNKLAMTGGSMFDNRAFYYDGQALQFTKKYAGQFGCDFPNNDDLVECLNEVSAHDLIEKSTFYIEFNNVDPITPFRATIEPNLSGAFLINDPFNVYETEQISDVPLLVGIAEREAGGRTSTILNKPEDLTTLNEDRYRIFPLTFSYRETVGNNSKSVTDAFYSHYFNNQSIDRSQTRQLINCYTDSQGQSGLDFGIHMNLNFLDSPVYYFIFNYSGTFSIADISGGLDGPEFRGTHVDELFYLFKMHPYYRAGKEPNNEDLEMVQYLTQIFVNFMYDRPPLNDWMPTRLPNLPYVTLNGPNNKVRSGEANEISKRMKFWRKVPYNTRLHAKITELEVKGRY